MITDVNVQKLADLIAERDQLRSKCERLEGACAEMRSALEMFRPMREQILSNTVTTRAFDKALSTEAGKAILSRLEEARRLLSESTAINVEVSGDWMFRRDQWLKGQP